MMGMSKTGRRLAVAGATVALSIAGLLPASAHHYGGHKHGPDGGPAQGCENPPALGTNGTHLSGWDVYAGQGGYWGTRSDATYAYAKADGNGITVSAFYPYFTGVILGKSHRWMDVSASAGPGGARSCDNSRHDGH
ncbi:MAG: hypothetical protein ACR2H3_02235 [Acidimicrobiales bacterium]